VCSAVDCRGVIGGNQQTSCNHRIPVQPALIDINVRESLRIGNVAVLQSKTCHGPRYLSYHIGAIFSSVEQCKDDVAGIPGPVVWIPSDRIRSILDPSCAICGKTERRSGSV